LLVKPVGSVAIKSLSCTVDKPVYPTSSCGVVALLNTEDALNVGAVPNFVSFAAAPFILSVVTFVFGSAIAVSISQLSNIVSHCVDAAVEPKFDKLVSVDNEKHPENIDVAVVTAGIFGSASDASE
jgi:hypothetical protein